MKRLRWLVILIAFLLVPSAVFAAGTYRSEVSVTDNSSVARTGVPALVSMGISEMVNQGLISSNGTDTRVFEGTSEQLYMVADDKLGILIPSLLANQERLFNFETGYSPPNTSFGFIPGTGGYLTVADNTTLELSDNFTIEQEGWVDTDNGSDKNLVYKPIAFKTYVSAAENITSIIYEDTTVWTTPTGHVAAGFVDPTNAYDDNAGTYAEDNTAIQTWSTWFELTIDESLCNKVRFISTWYDGGAASKAQIDIYYDSGWHNIFDDPFVTNPTWNEVSVYPLRTITAMRWRGYNAKTGGTGNIRLFEVDFGVSVANPVVEVTATNVSSSNHTVKSWADTTNLYISIDGAAEGDWYDSTALSGASVPDNPENWTFLQNDAIPYMEYTKITVDSTQELWFQPNDIVKGQSYSTGNATFTNGSTAVTGGSTSWTDSLEGSLVKSDTDNIWHVVSSVTDATNLVLTVNYSGTGGSGHDYTMAPRLPDRATSVANDGVITWGSNAGLDVSVSGLTSITSYVSTATEEGEAPVIVEEPGVIPGLFEDETEPTTMPWYDLFKPAAEQLDWGTRTLYGVMAIFVGIGLGVGVAVATGSFLLASIAVGVGLAVGAGQEVYGWWVVMAYGIITMGYLGATRSI